LIPRNVPLSKFTLPFIQRIEPKDKIFSTLKYGEDHIRALQESTEHFVNKSNSDKSLENARKILIDGRHSRNKSFEQVYEDYSYKKEILCDSDPGGMIGVKTVKRSR
jgi:hypothetical protein